MELDYSEIGKRIARRRKELGLKQTEVCERAEINDKYLSCIRFINPLLDTVVEWFGFGAETFYKPDDDTHFIVTTDVEISDQFYGWICGFRKKATIVSPPDVVADFQKFLDDIYGRYEDD